eukprot:40795-Rhodomonas_salina.1
MTAIDDEDVTDEDEDVTDDGRGRGREGRALLRCLERKAASSAVEDNKADSDSAESWTMSSVAARASVASVLLEETDVTDDKDSSRVCCGALGEKPLAVLLKRTTRRKSKCWTGSLIWSRAKKRKSKRWTRSSVWSSNEKRVKVLDRKHLVASDNEKVTVLDRKLGLVASNKEKSRCWTRSSILDPPKLSMATALQA